MEIKDKYTFKQFAKRCPAALPNVYFDKSTRSRPEDDELVDIMIWFKNRWPHHANSIAHPVNEVRGDHAGYGRDCKEKGKLTGVHDILLFVPASIFGFATFELKRSDHKSKVDESQVQVALANINNGGYSAIVWGVEACKSEIIKYMALRGE